MSAPTLLETHANWTAADVADAATWTTVLTDDQIDELEAALAHARSRCTDVLDITLDDFPLPTLAAVLSAIEVELIDGRGFARISGLPVERLGAEDSSWIYWGIGLHLGDPWPQNVKGHLLGDVKDQGKSLNDPTARGNEIGGAELTFHTDGSDLVGLLCLHPGQSGGASVIANSVAAHNHLVADRPDLASELYGNLPYDFRGEHRDGQQPFYFVPAFSEHNGRIFIRYIRPYIESSQRHAETPRLTSTQIEAMDAFDALIAQPELQVEMVFAPGDMQFINNYHVLHGRRAYTDGPEAIRHLKRLWLATNILGPDDRPERFQKAGATAHWGKHRTKA